MLVCRYDECFFFRDTTIEYFQIEDTFIENIPVRIARPLKDKGDLPAIVYFHGGAFYMGSVGRFDLMR